MKRSLLVFAFASGAAFAPFAACADDFAGAPMQADAQTDADAGVDRRPIDLDTSVPPLDSGPIFNAEGWIRVPFDPNCYFWAAPSSDKMPPPIEWETCSATVAPLGLACQQIRVTWGPSVLKLPMASSPSGWVDEKGKAWLLASRFEGDSVLHFVAEADGPVHQAMGYKVGRCHVTDGSLKGRRAIFTTLRTNSKGVTEQWGAVGGDVDAVPLVLESWPDGKGRGYIAGPSSYFQLGPETGVKAWAAGGPLLGQITVSDPGMIRHPFFVIDALFFQLSNSSYSRIKRYTVATGATDFISFGNDVSANAGDFGSDGVDTVWTEAFGRTSTSDPWTTINIMTAKFTSDPAQIQKRRLRSEKRTVGAAPYTVGCGYAAHDFASDEGNGVRIIRLSDGHSWALKQIVPATGAYWQFQAPLAITCDELFLNVNDSGEFRVARIRLDSLGPGEPPD